MAKVQKLLESGKFSVSGNYWEIFHQKEYYSDHRKANIRVDVSVEFRRTATSPPSFFVFIECKDYAGPVPVGDVEEFYAKTQQISGVNVKGILFTRVGLQEGAFNCAKSYGMAVVRLLHDDDLQWMIERTNQHLSTAIPNSIQINVINALTNEYFVSTRRQMFALYRDTVSYGLDEIFLEWLKAMDPGCLG